MAKSSKKRERTDEDVADNHDAKPAVKKSKLDKNGTAEVTKKSSKVKEAKTEAAEVEESVKPKKEKKDKKDKKEKKEKKDKKRKAKVVEETAGAESDEPAQTAPEPSTTEEKPTANGDSKEDKKSKKKKDKKDKKSKISKSTTTDSAPGAETNANANGEAEPTEAEEDGTTTNGTDKKTRFIVFVGNLPYTATAEAVREHFATLQPISVRLLTQRDQPTKSRGIAFVEFGGYDHMKTCLKKFHHTEFNDGKSAPRRINVELTAGGGGKTAARQDKIKQKNAKLNEERANRMQREEEAKLEKAANGGGAAGGAAGQKTQQERDEEAIHPSRRGRVPYGRH